MPEGRYVEFGEMKRVALDQAVRCFGECDAEEIVGAAEAFYLFLVDD